MRKMIVVFVSVLTGVLCATGCSLVTVNTLPSAASEQEEAAAESSVSKDEAETDSVSEANEEEEKTEDSDIPSEDEFSY
ncbi:MAG: hypothetical protein K5985_12300 [Lachnospiraceae bacterium]|nr:hypothetical protein [Lachnospiraceae bacterium]